MSGNGLPNKGTVKQVEKRVYSDGEFKYVTETTRTEKSDGSTDTYKRSYLERDDGKKGKK